MIKRRLLAAIVTAAMAILGLVIVAEPTVAAPRDVLGILTRDDATIEQLQALHVNTHLYVVWDDGDWYTLRDQFAAKAQAAGIKIWVWLKSPSICVQDECADYLPYHDDYVTWASQIATLSKRYPVVTGWAMDDFANEDNLEDLTPAYLTRVRQASRAIQPTLEFYPVVYHQYINPSFADKYAPVMDGVIMPFRDGLYRNTAWTSTVRNHVDSASTALASRNRKLVLMIYARKPGSAEIAPDVGYVRDLTVFGMDYMRRGIIEGVVHFGVDMDLDLPGHEDWNYSHGSGRGALAFALHPDAATSTGDFISASNTVRLNGGSTSCQVRIRHTDNRGTTSLRGHHFMQLLVNGRLLWEQDIAADDGGETGYHVTPWFNVTSLIGSSGAPIMLRLYEKRGVTNYHFRVRFDDLETVGCNVPNPSFESDSGWKLVRNDGPLYGAMHQYDPVYTTTVFTLLAGIFAD